MMSFIEIQKKWDLFLSKIETRFYETLDQTESLLPLLFDANDFDTSSFSVAWQGVYSQAQDLITKIEDTWNDKVDDQLCDACDEEEKDREQVDREREKADQLTLKLEQDLKSYEARIFSDAAKKLITQAKQVLAKDFCCTQCQANLIIKNNFFRSYYVTCEYCQTVNTFEPGAIARNVEHFSLHALAQEAALETTLKYDELYFRKYSMNDTSVKKKHLKKAYALNAEKYLKKRIEIIPDYAERYEKDLEARLSFLTKYQ